jgi:leader peptidase (prepilin peptidase)/N-methyltransferase
VYSGLALILVGVTVFDIRKQQIPHMVTVPGTIAGLVIGTFVLPLGFMESALGMVVGGGVLLISTIVEALRKKEIGGGDWKYAAMIGSFIGWQRIIVALVFTGFFGFIGALVLRASGTEGKPQALGPWLSAGAMASILFT